MTILLRTFALGQMLRASGAGRVGECQLTCVCVEIELQCMLRTLDDVARLFERQ